MMMITKWCHCENANYSHDNVLTMITLMSTISTMTNNLLSKTIESSNNTAIIIINLYVINDAVSLPESKDAGAVQQTAIYNVWQHSLSIVKQLLRLRTYNTCSVDYNGNRFLASSANQNTSFAICDVSTTKSAVRGTQPSNCTFLSFWK